MRKPQSCSEFLRFLPNHGVIRRFFPWTCSQVLCDRAYEFWWDLDLIWSFDHRVFGRGTNWKAFLDSNRVFTYHLLNRRLWSCCVGSTGARKIRNQRGFSSPRFLTNSTIEGPNHVQTLPNFVDMITKDLWTYPRKKSMNHSMVWEESRNSRARTGFSLERENFDSRRLVIPGGLALG